MRKQLQKRWFAAKPQTVFATPFINYKRVEPKWIGHNQNRIGKEYDEFKNGNGN